MVTEAQSKIAQCLSAVLRVIGQFSVLTGTEMHVVELGADAVAKVTVTMGANANDAAMSNNAIQDQQ